ncbi:zinc-dependent alcohol dehydrogenase family protein [Gluconacetobacter tumulisoli]|uniref:zinc-dependent alcohol dehydrogenase family protein n=1 Tax=Gluconacetobacter tumulisoli TaxID=1286189 RepID=UPI001C80D691
MPTKDQLLVRVHAASLNPVDLLIAGGHLPPAAPDLPAIPGLDFAGIVEAVGEAVTGFAVGDAVYGCAGGVKGRPGTFADYIAPEAALVAHKPRTLSMREAAAMPLVGITAWDGLVDRAALRADETVLIHGVTGGVSHAAIQIARSRGARVFATASSPEKAETARALGAVPIAYRTVPVADYVRDHTGGAGFDVVYDTVGGDVFEQSAQATRLYGRLVSCAAWQGHDLVPVLGHSLTLIGIFMLLPMLTGQGTARHGQILAALAALADTGALRPLLAERRFSLNEVGDAYALQAGGTAVGKIVIDIA